MGTQSPVHKLMLWVVLSVRHRTRKQNAESANQLA